MMSTCSPKAIRFETVKRSQKAPLATAVQQSSCAEELADVETVISRAALLMRRSMKKAA